MRRLHLSLTVSNMSCVAASQSMSLLGNSLVRQVLAESITDNLGACRLVQTRSAMVRLMKAAQTPSTTPEAAYGVGKYAKLDGTAPLATHTIDHQPNDRSSTTRSTNACVPLTLLLSIRANPHCRRGISVSTAAPMFCL